jgi:hypothetical protein
LAAINRRGLRPRRFFGGLIMLLRKAVVTISESLARRRDRERAR